MRTYQAMITAMFKSKFPNMNFDIASFNPEELEADYFDDMLNVVIPLTLNKSKLSIDHSLLPYVEVTSPKDRLIMKIYPSTYNVNTQRKLLIQICEIIQQHLRSRPFTIHPFNPSEFQLLDPNGMDYIGQYVTLADAKRTSGYNYLLI